MGKRDRPSREIKKAKKQPSKPVTVSSELSVAPTVEVVKRKRKSDEFPGED
jgi:hypothetical protein